MSETDEFRRELADKLRGVHWMEYACQGDAYFRWDDCSEVTQSVWLKIADKALDHVRNRPR